MTDDPLGWINENPLLLSVVGGLAVIAVTALFSRTRRLWALLASGLWAMIRLAPRLRITTSDRLVHETPASFIAPVRWAIRCSVAAGTAALINTSSGVARYVQVDDGSGTTVFGDAQWREIPGHTQGSFDCRVEELAALGGNATFVVKWTDLNGKRHYDYVQAGFGSD